MFRMWDVGCSECGMLRMWDVWNVECSGYRTIGMSDVQEIRVFGGM